MILDPYRALCFWLADVAGTDEEHGFATPHPRNYQSDFPGESPMTRRSVTSITAVAGLDYSVSRCRVTRQHNAAVRGLKAVAKRLLP